MTANGHRKIDPSYRENLGTEQRLGLSGLCPGDYRKAIVKHPAVMQRNCSKMGQLDTY